MHSQLDPAEGVADEGGVSVTLQTRGLFATASDPLRQLLRVGWRGASRFCTLAATLPHENATGVTVETDTTLAAWPSSGYFHVGAEAFYYASKAGTDFTDVTRAVAFTRPQAHFVDADGGRTPIITSEVVNWKTRPAVLQVANRRPDGTLGTFVDVARGFIDRTPKLSGDGHSIDLVIVPNTGLLTVKLGGQVAHSVAIDTEMVQRYHASDGSVATTWEIEQRTFEGAWNGDATGTLANSSDLDFDASDVTAFNLLFDTGRAAGHPRRGRILRWSTGIIREIDNTTPTTLEYAAGAAEPSTNVTAGEKFKSPAITDRVSVDVHARGVDAIVKWPDDAVAAITAAWVQGTHIGAAGLWADVKIEMGADHACTLLVRANASSVILLRLAAAQLVSPFGNASNRKCWYAFDMREPGDDEYVDPTDIAAGYPGWEWEGGANPREWRRFAIRVPDAWYQRGEKFLLLKHQVVDVSTATQHLRITHEGGQFVVPVTAISAAVDPDTAQAIGFRYTIEESHRLRVPSFGDWPGRPKVKVEPVIAFADESPITIALQVLSSGQGVGTNGDYDVLPFGLNLKVSADAATSEVDLASFLAFRVPVEVSRWSLILTGGETAGDILGPMMRIIGAAIVTRYDQASGRRVLALAPASIERALDSVVTIAHGEILPEGRPSSDTDDKVKNRYELEINHDPVTGEPGKPDVVFDDRPSIDEHVDTESLKMRLKGLRVAGDSPGSRRSSGRPGASTSSCCRSTGPSSSTPGRRSPGARRMRSTRSPPAASPGRRCASSKSTTNWSARARRSRSSATTSTAAAGRRRCASRPSPRPTSWSWRRTTTATSATTSPGRRRPTSRSSPRHRRSSACPAATSPLASTAPSP